MFAVAALALIGLLTAVAFSEPAARLLEPIKALILGTRVPPKPSKPARPAQPARPAFTASRVSLQANSSTRLPAGEPAKFTLAFELTGTQPVPAKAALAVRQPDGSLRYAAAMSEFTAVPGPNKKKLQFTPEAQVVSTELSVYGAVLIGGQTYLSDTPAHVTVVRTAGGAPPGRPSHVSPRASPAKAAQAKIAPPAHLRLTPTTPVRVPPGDTVYFDFTFDFTLADRMSIDEALAWRDSDGTLRYGAFSSATATRGPNVVRGLRMRVGTSAAPGTVYPVYGVIRINGQLYRSHLPALVTVIPPQ